MRDAKKALDENGGDAEAAEAAGFANAESGDATEAETTDA
jgi:translation elongation factor EF-Ts